jgi:hypothetical protein
MKLMKYNSNLLCSLVCLDSAKKFAAKGNIKSAIAVAQKGLQSEPGRFQADVRGQLKSVVESLTLPQ